MTSDAPVVDCRGQRCPLPIIALARHIVDVPVGAVLYLRADDPAAAIDVPAWCRLKQHDFLGIAGDPTESTFAIRRRH